MNTKNSDEKIQYNNPSINIFNESSLHNTLKLYYALNYEGKTEVKEDGHIYDILTKDNEVIEIQTEGLSKLKNKITDIIEKEKKVRLVYPLVNSKTIILTDENGQLVSKRKSPVKGSIYDIFSELTGIYPLLLNPNFTLEVVKINEIEHRLQTEEKIQSKNNKRRYLKNWIKVNKRLEDIICTYTFNSPKDYLKLLPESLPEEFCSKDLKNALLKTAGVSAKTAKNPNLILWVLVRIPVIEQTKIEKRSRYYKKLY